ncbi:MAG: bifunctional folylpolyglutamate synthase/dihydrofolate synthase [Pseudomonadota bacterium]|nr:bifunctional folylpolyglutamate synthase/dihydrofolate synthase [Pseudomonadota bacterium]
MHHPVLAGIDLSLDRMHRMLSVLGSPQKRLPPIIHVAGTNGKGSLLAYLQAVFEAAGYSVNRYTSPHLVRFNERIILRGKSIDDAALHRLLNHIAPFLQAQPATFFEATTALAFLAFAEHPADVLLLETGMGGRLDATNVIEKPLLTAITPISFDHTEYLGKTLTAIAGEKAGILKCDIPCIVGKQEAEAENVIEQKAAALNAPLYRYSIEWKISPSPVGGGSGWGHVKTQNNVSPPPGLPPTGGGVFYESPQRTLALTPSLAGKFQYDNAATAVACIDLLPQFAITDAHIAQGLSSAVWPARLQPITRGRYRDMLPPGIDLWLDGGHNPQGGEVLGEWLKEQEKPIYLICGMIRGKEVGAYLKFLAPYAAELHAVAIPGEAQSRKPEEIEKAAAELGMAAYSAASIEKALQTIAQRARTPALICICGSLYLAGKVLTANG